jgi:membrane protease YdiL (CAAX protease family)
MAPEINLPIAIPKQLTDKFPWRFIAIAFGISWTCWFFVALTGRNIFTELESGIVAVLGGFGPAIAGIIMVYRTNDQAFIRDYWRRVFDLRRIGIIWFLPILFLYPATVLLTFLLTGIELDASPLMEMLQNPGVLVTTVIFVFIFGPFSEELGWRDYALDWLQARYSAFVSSVILGVIWWAWHLPLLAVVGSFLYQNGHDPVFLMGYLYVVIIYSVLFTWVYNNNARSVLAIILLHFSINLTSRIFVMPAEIFTYNSFILIAVLALVLWRYGGTRLARDHQGESEAKS